MEILTVESVIILFFVGIIAGFLNVTAGGGSTLTLPVLIFLGLDSSMANGTNRIAILVQNISAVYSFKKCLHVSFNGATDSWKITGAPNSSTLNQPV